MPAKKNRVNSEITAKTLLVIDGEGHNLGVLTREAALVKADNLGLDLVEVSPNGTPPVCRILDYGKFRFAKKRKPTGPVRKRTQTKEIKLSVNIGQKDYDVKKNRVIDFLKKGNKVKVTLQFRGREREHRYLGLALLNRMMHELVDAAVAEQLPEMEGERRLWMLLVARTKK